MGQRLFSLRISCNHVIRDGKTGRHRNPEAGHLGERGAGLRYAFGFEFQEREDGLVGLRRAYGLDPADLVNMQQTLKYAAAGDGVIDVLDVYTTDASGLAATRATFADPENHAILPEIVSKEPLGPLVRHGDDQWADIVRWTLNALIAAEEYGVTSANIEELAKGTNNPEINRLLGTEGDLGAMLGLDAEWAKRAIMAGGNYGEIFAANIGEATPIGLARGLNAQWTDGGLLYSPPFR